MGATIGTAFALDSDRNGSVVASSLDRSGLAIVAMVAVAQCLPVWRHYWFDSHESYSYVLRVVEFAAALRQGELYPRWAPDFYGGFGSPFFVFYAPLVFAGSALFAAIAGSAVLGLKLWIALASIASGAGAYVLVKSETQRTDAALLAGLVYLACPYRLANIYVRGDIAEYTALAILPWAIWSYRRIAHALPIEDGVWRAALALALHAALVFSHAISGLWGTMLLGAVCLASTYQLVQRRTFRYVGLLWAAFALSLVASSVYTGPALFQKKYVQIAIAKVGYYEPLNQLLPVSSLVGTGQFGILSLVLPTVLLAACAFYLRRGSAAAIGWSAAAAAYALLSSRYAEAFWALKLPLTSFIQFPWRLHGFAALAAVVALGLSWSALFRRSAWREPAALVLGACALLASAPICAVTTPFAEGSFPETTSAIRSSIHHTTAHEYLPRSVPTAPRAPARALATSSPDIEVVSSWSRGSEHELELIAKKPGSTELALHLFPGWRVETRQGPAQVSIAASKHGRVSLRLPKPGSYKLRVSFGTSPVRALFGGLSLLALLASWPLFRFIVRRPAEVALLPRASEAIAPTRMVA